MSNEPTDVKKEMDTASVATTAEQITELWAQIHLMKMFATAYGKPIPPDVATLIAEAEDRADRFDKMPPGGDSQIRGDARMIALQKLLGAHGKLCDIVKPATPQTIEFSKPGTRLRNRFLWNNGLLALLSVAICGTCSVILAIGVPNYKVLLDNLNLVGAGGLGASFYNLYWIHHYLLERTFDRQYCVSYYIRWAMGLIAGYILASLVWSGMMAGDPSATKTIGATLVAAIGGFAADSVNDILLRLTETVKTLVAGRGDQAIKAQAASFEAETRRIKAQTQVEMARDLARAMSDARKEGASDAALKSIQSVIDGALGIPTGK